MNQNVCHPDIRMYAIYKKNVASARSCLLQTFYSYFLAVVDSNFRSLFRIKAKSLLHYEKYKKKYVEHYSNINHIKSCGIAWLSSY